MQEKVCIHCFVSGLVQGVWFRAGTLEEAQRLGLKGWVRNVPDGRVEVMVAGDKEQVDALVAWLQRGPPRAKVTEVVSERVTWQDHDGFNIT